MQDFMILSSDKHWIAIIVSVLLVCGIALIYVIIDVVKYFTEEDKYGK